MRPHLTPTQAALGGLRELCLVNGGNNVAVVLPNVARAHRRASDRSDLLFERYITTKAPIVAADQLVRCADLVANPALFTTRAVAT